MPVLQKLHNLRSLYLHDRSYIGSSMVCYKGGFPQLLVLKMSFLFNLEELILEEQALQKLVELEIVYSDSPKVLTGLENLKTLQQLKLTIMSKEFTATIEETKVQIWANLAILIRRPWWMKLKTYMRVRFVFLPLLRSFSFFAFIKNKLWELGTAPCNRCLVLLLACTRELSGVGWKSDKSLIDDILKFYCAHLGLGGDCFFFSGVAYLFVSWLIGVLSILYYIQIKW